jgi:hypothetical protein
MQYIANLTTCTTIMLASELFFRRRSATDLVLQLLHIVLEELCDVRTSLTYASILISHCLARYASIC